MQAIISKQHKSYLLLFDLIVYYSKYNNSIIDLNSSLNNLISMFSNIHVNGQSSLTDMVIYTIDVHILNYN